MTGGPAQHETFDPKPDAPSGVRGEFGAIDTSVPGIRISELMPHMAKQAHRYAILRSTYHKENGHGPATHWSLTGKVAVPRPRTGSEPSPARIDPPCVGGVVRQLKGDPNGLPGAVQLPARIGDQNTFMWAGQHSGYLGERYDPLMLIDETWIPGDLPPTFKPNPQVGEERLRTRSHLLQELEGVQKGLNGPPIDSFRIHRERALSVLDSTTAWEAFLLKNEKPETIARYGDTRFGRSCLIARRLVEAGVGHVTVTWYPDPPTKFNSEANFDTHGKHFTKMKNLLMPPVDRAFAALLEDLAERGLLDETLVAWTGEFGRTPKINGGAGRDHWGERVQHGSCWRRHPWWASAGFLGQPGRGAEEQPNPRFAFRVHDTLRPRLGRWDAGLLGRPPATVLHAGQAARRVVLNGVWLMAADDLRALKAQTMNTPDNAPKMGAPDQLDRRAALKGATLGAGAVVLQPFL